MPHVGAPARPRAIYTEDPFGRGLPRPDNGAPGGTPFYFSSMNSTLRFFRRDSSSLLGTSGFWLASAVLRLSVFAWIPVTFGIHDNATIGIMIMISGVGLICGAVLTPRLVPPGNRSRIIVAGALMGISLILLPWVTWLQAALLLQAVCGGFGGIYVIPLNAMLQRVGEMTVGTGKIIAIQNFSENVFMFGGVLCFLAASSFGVPVAWSMAGNGIVLLGIVSCLYWMGKKLKR